MQKKSRLVKRSFPYDKNIFAEVKDAIGPCSAHYHNFYEIDIVLKGEGESVCNGETFPIKRGMVTLMTPEDLHSYNMQDKMCEINIQFTYDAVDPGLLSFWRRTENRVVYVDAQKLSRICSLFCLLQGNDGVSDAKSYSSKILECIILSLKSEYKQSTIKEAAIPSALQKALIYIHSNFKEDPKMCNVAEYVYLNENYFCSMFKKQIGQSYKEYIRNLKLAHARKLILYTDLPITKISYDSGYRSQSHFNREFLKNFGTSPMAMRKKQPSNSKA